MHEGSIGTDPEKDASVAVKDVEKEVQGTFDFPVHLGGVNPNGPGPRESEMRVSNWRRFWNSKGGSGSAGIKQPTPSLSPPGRHRTPWENPPKPSSILDFTGKWEWMPRDGIPCVPG